MAKWICKQSPLEYKEYFPANNSCRLFRKIAWEHGGCGLSAYESRTCPWRKAKPEHPEKHSSGERR